MRRDRAVVRVADVRVTQLAAGGHEVSAVGDAAFDEEAAGFELGHEGLDGFVGGGLVSGGVLGVVRDEVDDAGGDFGRSRRRPGRRRGNR